MIYFISGHRDITEEEFNKYYVPELIKAVQQPDSKFIVGDYEGVDIMAQKWLSLSLNDKKRVTVCHMFTTPRNLATQEFNTHGGFKSDEERDAWMTENSDIDIAFVRPGKRRSGTAQNLVRRHEMK